MPYDPARHHRRSIRLQGYDYHLAGAYFVTLCAQDRACLFHTAAIAQVIEHWWYELPAKFATVSLDAFVVMPNHVHGLVVLECPDSQNNPTLGEVIQWFKTMTTNAYIQGVKGQGWPPFHGRLWQRNYYEHIVRNDREMIAIRYYIEANPQNWAEDENNPQRLTTAL